ncbi:MAG: flagellar biosynthesis protein FlgB [Balneolaceae bacterium]|nr:MAG: flagellar biosynthesis protein FlgB [Balneolaceae bacterium]
MKLIDTTITKLLGKAMDAYALRQKTHAANIANMDTPGFKKLKVEFESRLQEASSSRNSTIKMHEVNAEITQGDTSPDLEEEMLEMVDTQIRAHLSSRALRHNFQLLKSAITSQHHG